MKMDLKVFSLSEVYFLMSVSAISLIISVFFYFSNFFVGKKILFDDRLQSLVEYYTTYLQKSPKLWEELMDLWRNYRSRKQLKHHS